MLTRSRASKPEPRTMTGAVSSSWSEAGFGAVG
jgi:hypothetical protein